MERFNTEYIDFTVATSTTEQILKLPDWITDWSISAGTTDCRIRFQKPLVVSSEDSSGSTSAATLDAYFYDASGDTWSALTLPWTLNSMKATDKILLGVEAEVIAGIELDIGNTNSSGATMAAKYAYLATAYDNNFPKYLSQMTFAAQRLTSDGTANGGATLGKDGLILLGPPLQRNLVCFSKAIAKGRFWTELSVSAGLDNSVSVIGQKILGEHTLITQGATAISGESRFNKIYYRLDSGAAAGTLRIIGQY